MLQGCDAAVQCDVTNVTCNISHKCYTPVSGHYSELNKYWIFNVFLTLSLNYFLFVVINLYKPAEVIHISKIYKLNFISQLFSYWWYCSRNFKVVAMLSDQTVSYIFRTCPKEHYKHLTGEVHRTFDCDDYFFGN